MNDQQQTATGGDSPIFARRNDTGYYTWDGEQYKSVTTYLDHYSSGEHLKLWYAKMAANDCAHQLYLRDQGHITAKAADDRIRDFGKRMLAAVIYRDFRGHIGSLVHHTIHQESLGTDFPTKTTVAAWMLAEARRMGLLDTVDDSGEMREASMSDYMELADAAAPYFMVYQAWRAAYLPRYEMLGLEACVISQKYRYAGTMDAIAVMQVPNSEDDAGRSKTGRFIIAAFNRLLALAEEGEASEGQLARIAARQVRLAVDFKTSNSLSDSFRMQVEAYTRADFIGVMPGPGQPEPLRYEIGEIDGVAILHMAAPKSGQRVNWDCHLHGWAPSERVFRGFLGLMDCVDVLGDKDEMKQLRVDRTPKAAPAPVRTTVRPAPF